MANWDERGKAAIIGVGFSTFSRQVEKPLGQLVLDSCQAALDDGGIASADVDGLATFPEAPYIGSGRRDGQDLVTVDYVINRLRPHRVQWFAQLDDGMVLNALIEAVHAVIARRCRNVLVWRALYKPPGRYGLSRTPLARGNSQFSLPYGCASPVQWHAFQYQRYMALHGARREHMATLAISSRNNAHLNPNAIFKDTPLSFDEYMQADLISDPLCLFDCDVPTNGAICLLLTHRDNVANRERAAVVLGYGQNTTRRRHVPYYTLLDYMEPGGEVGRQMWQTSGVRPEEINVAEFYDGFAPSVYYWLESLGFCSRGEAFEFVQHGRVSREGDLPVNTDGGSLSAGRMHGMGHLAEAVLQVTGRAGSRQVNGCKRACVTVGSPMLRGGGVVLAGMD